MRITLSIYKVEPLMTTSSLRPNLIWSVTYANPLLSRRISVRTTHVLADHLAPPGALMDLYTAAKTTELYPCPSAESISMMAPGISRVMNNARQLDRPHL
jgi:hypothetical protein